MVPLKLQVTVHYMGKYFIRDIVKLIEKNISAHIIIIMLYDLTVFMHITTHSAF